MLDALYLIWVRKEIMWKACMLGIGIGDAFGFGILGQDRKWIQENVNFTEYVSMRDDVEPGVYSENTRDTIAIMLHLINNEAQTPETLLNYLDMEYKFDAVMSNEIYSYDYQSLPHFIDDNPSSIKTTYLDRSSIVRAILLGVLPCDNIDLSAGINADIIYRNVRNRVANILIARASEYILVKQGLQSGVIDYCRNYVYGMDPETDMYLFNIDRLNNIADITDVPSSDYCLLVGDQPIQKSVIRKINSDPIHIAGTALYLLKYCTNAMEALERSMLIGGDISVIGAIVVGIIAGRHGLDGIPNNLIRQLEGRKRLVDISNIFDKSWQQRVSL